MSWLLNALRRRRMERAIAEDIESHIEEKTAALMESGMSEAAARLQARREFGNVGLWIEDSREVWGWRWLDQFTQDLRHGIRMLARNPGFTTVAILSLT